MPDEFIALLARMSSLGLHASLDDAGQLRVSSAKKIGTKLRASIAKFKPDLIRHIREQEQTETIASRSNGHGV